MTVPAFTLSSDVASTPQQRELAAHKVKLPAPVAMLFQKFLRRKFGPKSWLAHRLSLSVQVAIDLSQAGPALPPDEPALAAGPSPALLPALALVPAVAEPAALEVPPEPEVLPPTAGAAPLVPARLAEPPGLAAGAPWLLGVVDPEQPSAEAISAEKMRLVVRVARTRKVKLHSVVT